MRFDRYHHYDLVLPNYPAVRVAFVPACRLYCTRARHIIKRIVTMGTLIKRRVY